MRAIRLRLAEPVPVTALSLFRIGFAALTLVFLAELLIFRHLIFDGVPYLTPATWPVAGLLLTAIIAEILILVGLFTKPAAAVAWLIYTFVLGHHLGWYHAEWAFITMHLLLVFLPTSETLSLQSLLRRRRTNSVRVTPTVPIGYYLIPLYLALGLMYFDSVIWKLGSWHWVEGLGVWRPMSTLWAAQFDLTPLLNVKPVMIAASWVTVFYEAVFVVAMWFRRLRLPLMLLGLGLHLGILVAFPIPIFAVQSCLILSLLVPTWPRWIAEKFGRRVEETAAQSVHLTLAPTGLIVAALGAITAAQLLITSAYSVPFLTGRDPVPALRAAAEHTRNITRPYLGVTTHDVFIAPHFDGHGRVYRLVDSDTERPLPIVDNAGRPTHLLSHDQFWCAWVFFNFREDPTENTLARYAGYELGPEKLKSGDRHDFTVQVKRFREARHWRPNALRDAERARWRNVGVLRFEDRTVRLIKQSL